MPAANSLTPFPTFGAYADPLGAAETAMTLWTQAWRTSMGAMFWWTERCLQAPIAFLAWAPAPAYTTARRPGAAVIDLAQAAAARVAAEVSDIASAALDVAETAAEIPVSVAEELAQAAPTAIREEPETVAPKAMFVLPEPDDLTRMVGIGPKLAAALAERGVTSFAQIAAWTDQELADFDKDLELKGRASRDAWVAQAKRFVKEAEKG
jgi:predicted flap endonuclease-1-like 5' DNA nuclease